MPGGGWVLLLDNSVSTGSYLQHFYKKIDGEDTFLLNGLNESPAVKLLSQDVVAH